MPLWIPNEFLTRFCDVVERHGMAGKFSIVPAPGGRGDVVAGIEGHDPALTREWLDIARARLGPRWSFCSEGITHNLAVDLVNGGYLPESENAWSQRQDRTTLTPYLVRQLELLRDAGIDASGVTSPWVFGVEVEPEYCAAIVAAQREVYGRRFSWYFLHTVTDPSDARPWTAHREGDTVLVSVPASTNDVWWVTIDSPRTDRAFIEEIADQVLGRDGCSGRVGEVLEGGGWPVLLTHWQSLFSNGLETGLAALDEVGERISATLAGEVEWLSCLELAQRAVAETG
jgi:hypothetical protein